MAYYAYKTVRDSVPHDFMEKYRDDSSDPCDYDGWMWYGAAGYIELLGTIRTAAIVRTREQSPAWPPAVVARPVEAASKEANRV